MISIKILGRLKVCMSRLRGNFLGIIIMVILMVIQLIRAGKIIRLVKELSRQ
jgi:hypothetical protein